MQRNQDASKDLNILCIDGGGVRGLSSLIILREIMGRIQATQGREIIHPYEHFDVIAGTGTGGISACMLGRLRMPVDKAIEKYAKLVEEVFKDKKFSGVPMYKATKLQEALETMMREVTGDGAEMMVEDQTNNPCKTMVFAMARHNLNAGLPVIFRSYPVTTNSGPNCTICEALRATLAHPDLFKGIEIIDCSVPQSFVGGDIGCSNPLAHVLSEVERHGSWERLGEAMQHAKGYLQKNTTNQMLKEVVRISTERYNAVTTAHAAGQISGVSETAKPLVDFKRCPPPTKFYTGRTDENAQVIACITREHHKRRVCVVYGLGGAGKTQLVLNVIEQTWDQWAHIIYVDASSDEAIEKVFKEFGAAKNTGDTSKDVVNWLESCKERWLIVFDNADTPSTDIQRYIPARGGGSVVITTRLPDLARLSEGSGSVCHLSNMSLSDGAALLLKITSMRNQSLPDTDVMAAEELVQASVELGGLALAIVHAGAYIAHSLGITITRYHNLLLSERRRMLDEYNELPKSAKLDECGNTVYTTWHICYDKLKPESRQLLWLIAYLHYDGVSEELFKRAATLSRSKRYPLPLSDVESQAYNYVSEYLSTFLDADGNWDAVRFMRPMSDLISYSLIDFDRMNHTYRAHILVHDWAKTVVEQPSELAIECSASLLSLSVDSKEDTVSLGFKRRLGLHVTSVLALYPKIGGNHSYYFGKICRANGQWGGQLKMLEPLVEVFTQALGEDHLDTLRLMNNLALAYLYMGQYNKAEPLLVQVLDARKHALGGEHPSTLTAMNDLATTYLYLGQYNKAEQLQVQVCDARKRVRGDKRPHSLTSMNNLAMTYSRLGQHDKAEELHILVLDARKRELGDKHPDTLRSMNNLAATYSDLKQFNKAEQLQVQVLDACKRELGDKHPDTLRSTNNLAWTYSALGRWDEAAKLYHSAIAILEQTLGDQHPHTQVCRRNLLRLHKKRQG